MFAQTLPLPPRPTNAVTGFAFAQSITPLDPTNREEKIYEQIALGNVPDFLRKLHPIHAEIVHNDATNSATYFVTPDYLAVGSDDDYFFTPLTPIMAQRVANLLDCSLPTRKMVDDIYRAADVKLPPAPIPPSSAMTSVTVFVQHNLTVHNQRAAELTNHPLGALVAGDKKDVVITAKLAAAPGKVAIYGWHKSDATPIQPLYIGHAETWADYSHGIRLVQNSLTVDGVPRTVSEILTNTALCGLLSDEGPFTQTRYPISFSSPSRPSELNRSTSNSVTLAPIGGEGGGEGAVPSLTAFQPAPLDERTFTYTIASDVIVTINQPQQLDPHKPLEFIFYTLPNGNTTAQTIGKQLEPGDDWHFDIQHIGAQTRFLRNVLTNETLVVAYLETSQKSWPTWRKTHADHPEFIPQIFNVVKDTFTNFDVHITLASHSGGGSAIFGYLNAVDRIPADVDRIAFLDSDYAYDKSAGHADKLLQWLQSSTNHFLSVLAYHDSIALLNGKTFVSAEGGTWGRSHAMLADLGSQLKFTSTTNGMLETDTALDGRVKFLLMENPDKKILHTVQVEKNGFIQSLLSGTPYEGQGYTYFGDRAYTNLIAK